MNDELLLLLGVWCLGALMGVIGTTVAYLWKDPGDQ